MVKVTGTREIAKAKFITSWYFIMFSDVIPNNFFVFRSKKRNGWAESCAAFLLSFVNLQISARRTLLHALVYDVTVADPTIQCEKIRFNKE